MLCTAHEVSLLLLQEVIPVGILKGLQLEDGIDPTRKPDYLSEQEYFQVFRMNRMSFALLPAWRQVNAKKNVGLF